MNRVCLAVVVAAACSTAPRQRTALPDPVVTLRIVNELSVPLCQGGVMRGGRTVKWIKPPIAPGERREVDVPAREIEVYLHACVNGWAHSLPLYTLQADRAATLVVLEPGRDVPSGTHALTFTPPAPRTRPSRKEPVNPAPRPLASPAPCPPSGTAVDAHAAKFLVEMPQICETTPSPLLIRNTCARATSVTLDIIATRSVKVDLPARACTAIDASGIVAVHAGGRAVKGCVRYVLLRVDCDGNLELENTYDPRATP